MLGLLAAINSLQCVEDPIDACAAGKKMFAYPWHGEVDGIPVSRYLVLDPRRTWFGRRSEGEVCAGAVAQQGRMHALDKDDIAPSAHCRGRANPLQCIDMGRSDTYRWVIARCAATALHPCPI
jgi:hypothetical protein